MARKASHSVNWALIVAIAVPLLTFIGTMAAFYYQTNATLAKYDEHFKKLDEDFKGWDATSKKNFADWMTFNKESADKAEARAKEEREAREKIRNDFMQFVSTNNASLAAMKVQQEVQSKSLEKALMSLDNISSVQQEGRILRQQQRR